MDVQGMEEFDEELLGRLGLRQRELSKPTCLLRALALLLDFLHVLLGRFLQLHDLRAHFASPLGIEGLRLEGLRFGAPPEG